MTPVVELHGAAVGHDGRPVLSGVDLRVDAGEVVAVLGANGSGKSTLVRAVVGLVPLLAGELRLFGEPAARVQRTRLGYVPQRTGAATGVPSTVREVVATGRLARVGRLRRSRPDDRDAVTRALEVVDLLPRARDAVATLSGGQQQRVLIARALAGDPELLVMDEPTAGVDLASQEALAVAVQRMAERGTTVLLVLHELGPLQGLVRRAVTLAEGRVLHDGPPPEPDHLHLHDPEHAHPPHEAPHVPGSAWGLR
ncbi:MAG TPA: ABC transporter ATP-binding protein [Mycobacteriales bacterium]|nr:ABC transporter ATP-binding protein [Mycobacteriales bacterium]